MSNNLTLTELSQCLTQVPEIFLHPNTEITEIDTSVQSIQISAEPEQRFSLLNSMYEAYLNASDDQHTSSLGLDYLMHFNDDHDHYEIQSNPEAEKIFARIDLVNQILKYDYVKAYRELHPNHLLSDIGQKYEAIDKNFIAALKQVLKQGCDPLEKYDCEHSKVIVKAFNEVLRRYYHADNHPNDSIVLNHADGTQTVVSYAELINQFVERINQLTYGKEFKYQQKKRMDRSRYQQKTAIQCVNAILAKHSRIEIIRLDLRYGKTQNPRLSQVKEDLQTFLRYLKRTNSLNDVGYIWKCEFAEKTGYHFHCFFFLDGRLHSQDIKLAQQIGEIWKKVVGSEGVYHNCNLDAHKGKYRDIGIGTLHRNDQEKYQYLIAAIRYITKRDQFIVHKQMLEDEEKERQLSNKKSFFVRVFGTNVSEDVAKNMGRPPVNAQKEDV